MRLCLLQCLWLLTVSFIHIMNASPSHPHLLLITPFSCQNPSPLLLYGFFLRIWSTDFSFFPEFGGGGMSTGEKSSNISVGRPWKKWEAPSQEPLTANSHSGRAWLGGAHKLLPNVWWTCYLVLAPLLPSLNFNTIGPHLFPFWDPTTLLSLIFLTTWSSQ